MGKTRFATIQRQIDRCSPNNKSVCSESNDTPESGETSSSHNMALSDRSLSPSKKQNDYDLTKFLQFSQSLFERRMTKAESPAKDIIRMNQNRVSGSTPTLDLSVACEPDEFSDQWESLPLGLQIHSRAMKAPLMREFHEHFGFYRINIIASGVVGNGVMKFFLIAQYRGSRCLMELKFDPTKMDLHIQFKMNDCHRILFFARCLRLQSLFDDSIDIIEPEDLTI